MENYTNIFDLSGKVALVTGAGGGIGQAIAYGLAAFGADIMVGGHRLEKAEVTAEGVRKLGRKAKAVSFELTDVESINKLVEDTLDEFGKIDVLVNSAGKNVRKYVVDITEEDWDTVLDINLKGVLFTCQAAARHMIERKQGKILNISSISSMLGHPARCAYAGSKGGLNQISRVMATELAPYGINVNTISPAAIDTPFIDGLKQNREKLDRELQRIPMGRIGTPKDMIGAAVFMASEASDFITGHNLVVDGGRTVD